jgi:hypothetical protein
VKSAVERADGKMWEGQGFTHKLDMVEYRHDCLRWEMQSRRDTSIGRERQTWGEKGKSDSLGLSGCAASTGTVAWERKGFRMHDCN